MEGMKMTEKQPEQHQQEEGLVRKLAIILSETGLTEIEVESQELRVRVAKNGVAQTHMISHAQVANQPQPIAEAPKTASPDDQLINAINSPMVGTVYLSSKPGAPTFVKEGDMVKEGQTLLIIEAMKVMNPLPAPKAGKLTRMIVSDGTPVEFGQPLLIIE